MHPGAARGAGSGGLASNAGRPGWRKRDDTQGAGGNTGPQLFVTG